MAGTDRMEEQLAVPMEKTGGGELHPWVVVPAMVVGVAGPWW